MEKDKVIINRSEKNLAKNMRKVKNNEEEKKRRFYNSVIVGSLGLKFTQDVLQRVSTTETFSSGQPVS